MTAGYIPASEDDLPPLRDLFAGLAMQALLSRVEVGMPIFPTQAVKVADLAYLHADAMLARRAQKL